MFLQNVLYNKCIQEMIFYICVYPEHRTPTTSYCDNILDKSHVTSYYYSGNILSTTESHSII